MASYLGTESIDGYQIKITNLWNEIACTLVSERVSFTFRHNLLPPSSWYYPVFAGTVPLPAVGLTITLWAFITVTTLNIIPEV